MSKNDKQSLQEIDDGLESIESLHDSDNDTEEEDFQFKPIKQRRKDSKTGELLSDTDEESVVSMSVSSQYTAHEMISLARKENGLSLVRTRKLNLLDFSALKNKYPRRATDEYSDDEGERAPIPE